ncbi:obscurin-like_isoform X4 [Hexamita inflata]|uniref:Obscurin-like isoform X4 n=1 Tax=Hexamita inflata TaxID=28002 RepID=A0AA86UUV2_9EUKA|nr:obscurin-like isoform X4 [Hexamita inflata]
MGKGSLAQRKQKQNQRLSGINQEQTRLQYVQPIIQPLLESDDESSQKSENVSITVRSKEKPDDISHNAHNIDLVQTSIGQSSSQPKLKTTEQINEQQNLNSIYIRREFEQVNERVIQFVNNKQRELMLEISNQQAQLEDQTLQNEITALKQKNIELQKQNSDIKMEYEQKIIKMQEDYAEKLKKCNKEVETLKTQYQQDLKKQYEIYQTEIKQLKQDNEVEKQYTRQSNEIHQKQQIQELNVSDQLIQTNDSITKQLQIECQLLKQQLIEEKQAHDDEYRMMTEQLKYKTQRNSEIQKQLTAEKTQRLIYFQQLTDQQSEIAKQLENKGNTQTEKILQLEADNLALQLNMTSIKQEIEKQDIPQYLQTIQQQKIQLQNKDGQVKRLMLELKHINLKLLQDRKIEALTMLQKLNSHID